MLPDHVLARVLPGSAIRLFGPLVRLGLWTGLLIWCAAWLTVGVARADEEIRHANYSDFGRFLYSARQYVAGQTMYAPVPEALRSPQHAARQRTNLNPPHLHVLFLPLAKLSDSVALTFWCLASVVAAIGAAAMILRALQVRITARLVGAALAATVSSVPFQAWMITGQIVLILLPPVTLAWIATRERRWRSAGIWIGILWSVKPFLVLLPLYLLVRRQWLAFAWACVAWATAFAVGLMVFGLESHLGWLRDLNAVTWFFEPRNASLLGLASRTFDHSTVYASVSFAPSAVVPMWTLSSLVVLISTFLAIWFSKHPDLDWVLLMTAALLVSPLGWVYYWWWLAGPIVGSWLWLRGKSRLPSNALLLGSLSGWVPWSVLTWQQPSGWLTLTLGSVYAWGLVVITATLIVAIAAHRSPVSSRDECAHV